MMNQLKAWWLHLELRERNFIKYGSIAITLLCFYVTIWAPFLEDVQAQQQSLDSQRALLAWMQNATIKVQALQKQDKTITKLTPDAALTIIDQSLKDNGLSSSISELKQTADLKVTVTFKQVNFDELMQWLITIRKQYGLQVDQIAIEQPATIPGIIQARLVVI